MKNTPVTLQLLKRNGLVKNFGKFFLVRVTPDGQVYQLAVEGKEVVIRKYLLL